MQTGAAQRRRPVWSGARQERLDIENHASLLVGAFGSRSRRIARQLRLGIGLHRPSFGNAEGGLNRARRLTCLLGRRLGTRQVQDTVRGCHVGTGLSPPTTQGASKAAIRSTLPTAWASRCRSISRTAPLTIPTVYTSPPPWTTYRISSSKPRWPRRYPNGPSATWRQSGADRARERCESASDDASSRSIMPTQTTPLSSSIRRSSNTYLMTLSRPPDRRGHAAR